MNKKIKKLCQERAAANPAAPYNLFEMPISELKTAGFKDCLDGKLVKDGSVLSMDKTLEFWALIESAGVFRRSLNKSMSLAGLKVLNPK